MSAIISPAKMPEFSAKLESEPPQKQIPFYYSFTLNKSNVTAGSTSVSFVVIIDNFIPSTRSYGILKDVNMIASVNDPGSTSDPPLDGYSLGMVYCSDAFSGTQEPNPYLHKLNDNFASGFGTLSNLDIVYLNRPGDGGANNQEFIVGPYQPYIKLIVGMQWTTALVSNGTAHATLFWKVNWF